MTNFDATTRNIETICALSPMQEGLLFHALLAPDSAVYFEQVSCRLSALEDTAAFRRAWQMATDRHVALRTGFYWKNRKRPLQIVRRQCDLTWSEKDWRGIEPDQIEPRLSELLEDDRRRGFDLSQAPLMRCTLLRLRGGEYQFIWSHHHLILDGWSASLVVREVFTTYEALLAGRDPHLPLPRPF
ncbi:MAG TPA: condensation domain-containing protein, partial [Bryobacteraceae bacterium]